MVMSIRVMSDASGVDYLLHTVVAGDGVRELGSPLTRYYQETGAPSGRWAGSAVALLGHDAHSRLREGDVATQEALHALFGQARDPLTGLPLGNAHGKYATAGRTAMAGYDLTFSPPKSVSALWAVTDAGTQALIWHAHHEALSDVLGLLERRVAATRVGKGGAGRMDVDGVVAASFDHYDSRAGDPQLHTHLIVANRVRGVDGLWRTLDGTVLHQAVVALSATYNAVLADRLTGLLGVGWVPVSKGRERNTWWELDGVPNELTAAFSGRTLGSADRNGIDARKDELIATWAEAHGRSPSARTVAKLRQQATLETRPAKHSASLTELTARWRTEASGVLGEDATTWARALLSAAPSVPVLRGDDLAPEALDGLAAAVLVEVGSKRAVWRRWNLWAEAARQTMGVRFASMADREAVLLGIVERAEDASLRLTPAYDRTAPGVFRLRDEAPAFQPRDTVAYSSQATLDAEQRLLAASTAPGLRLAPERVAPFVLLPSADGLMLAEDQAVAVMGVATSGRALDVLVGPAGAGKTTALRALRSAWEARAGRGMVVGLAPSAAAAEVLGEALGIRTENTAKWDVEHAAGRWDLRRGQLVLVDEASLAGTLMLDRLVAHAGEVGGKVVLVGDWAQLNAIDTGGAFGLLVRSREDAPELTDVRRFREEWEKAATLGLRHGDVSALREYASRGRVHDEADALDAVYTAWLADREAGLRTVMIAGAASAVAELGMRARADRVALGAVAADGLRLHDGTLAGIGDEVVTRLNDRRLATESGSWVKNGDRWQVTARFDDGSLAVRRMRKAGLGASMLLPAAYVAEHVELAYATTVHRAQGLTVDTAHALVDPATATREVLYVAMTRGALANHVYVQTPEPDPVEGTLFQPVESVLADVMARVGAEPSAIETLRLEVDAHASLPILIREYETIAAHTVHLGAATWPWSDGRRDWERREHRVGGLITAPNGNPPAEYAEALNERAALIERAASRIARRALDESAPWVRGLDREAAVTVALYRAKYDVRGTDPLGDLPASALRRQERERANAQMAIHRAQYWRQEADAFREAARPHRAPEQGRSIGF